MARREERGKSGTRTLIIILCVVGGGFLLAALACGGCIYFGVKAFPEIQAAQQSADLFLNDLGAGRVDQAYQTHTTQAFQASQSLAQFRAWVNQYPAVTTQTSRQYSGVRIHSGTGGTQAFIQATVLGPNNTLSFTLILVKENDQWKVNRITVP
jgi:hypothetical protein